MAFLDDEIPTFSEDEAEHLTAADAEPDEAGEEEDLLLPEAEAEAEGDILEEVAADVKSGPLPATALPPGLQILAPGGAPLAGARWAVHQKGTAFKGTADPAGRTGAVDGGAGKFDPTQPFRVHVEGVCLQHRQRRRAARRGTRRRVRRPVRRLEPGRARRTPASAPRSGSEYDKARVHTRRRWTCSASSSTTT